MKHLWIGSLLFSFSLFAAAGSSDQKLMVKFGQGDASEVELAKIVASNATTAEAMDFANLMIADHSRAFDRLQKIASAENVTLSRGMDDEHQKFAAKLAKTKLGRAYDRTYIGEMVKDHVKDTNEVKKSLSKISNPDFRNWAQDELQTVQKHLKLARQARARLR